MKQRFKFIKSGAVAVAAFGMLATAVPVAFADSTSNMPGMSSSSSSSTTAGQQWTMLMGASAADNSLQAMAFFPNVMTIDAGDTINFKLNGYSPHTVSFAGSDGKLPNPTTPGWDQPAGGKTYDGSAFTSSGMIMPGSSYSLQFTKPGVYLYHCLMHPGMQGVIIVQPAGTAYPLVQSQYDALAAQQSQADLTAAQSAADSVQQLSSPGSKGTTVWKVQADLPESLNYTANLASANNSAVTGSATFSMSKPGTWNVELKLKGLTAGTTYTPALNLGKSDSGTAVPGTQLNAFTAAADGTADVTGTVSALSIPQGIWFVDVDDSTGSSVASGLVNYPSYTDERFLPDPLSIHVGDTVEWTQWGPNEAHTISFLPRAWKDVPNENMMFQPTGGTTYSGDGFYNSGLLFPGQKYSLTFDAIGSFQYRCLLHDTMGMYGKVRVLPKDGVIVSIDGKDLDTDLVPFVANDHTQVPLRSVFETVGAKVSWDNSTQTVTAANGNTTVVLQIGSKAATVNGQSVNLDTAPQLVDNSTFVPVTFLKQAFGYQVSWNQDALHVNIATK